MHSIGQIRDTAHPTTNRSFRGINSLVPPRTLNLQLFLDGVRPDIIVAEIFQHLGTRISFQVKENSNPKQTTVLSSKYRAVLGTSCKMH